MKVGDTFNSNQDGQMTVVAYVHNEDITVEFLDTGNRCKAQKHAILNGFVRDVCMRRQKRDLLRQEATARAVFKRHITALRILIKDLAGWKRDDARAQKIRRRELYRNKFFAKCKRLSRERTKELSRQRYRDNREVLLQASKDYQKANLDKARVRNQNRRAKRINAEGSHTLAEVNAMLVAQGYKCNCCGCNLEDGKHLDHIMPLDLGGSNWIENLQWLCVWCNCSKSAKHPDEWAKEVASPGFLSRRFGGAISLH